jgi:TM2 domain-containing membrane protein YozV
MLLFDGAGGLVFLAVWIFCFIDVLTTPESACRNLPKLAWVFIVLLLPLIGTIGWLVAGHPWNRTQVTPKGSTGRTAPTRRVPTNPDDDEEFLAGLRLRAEEQRRRAREQPDRDPRDGSDGNAG